MNYVLIALLVLLAAWAIWRTVQRLRRGSDCCGEREPAEKRIVVADRNKAHYPYELRLRIAGMSCANCAVKVQNALNRLPGVWASVRIEDHRALIRSKTPPDEAAIRAAVREAGYAAAGKE